MSNQTLPLDESLYEYVLDISLREHDLLKRLREETAQHSMARMQIAPEQGQFMAMLARLMGARRYLEVGVFTGYSALVVAMALPADGEVIGLDINPEYTDVAKRYWAQAGVSKKMDLRLRPALESLQALLKAGRSNEFDLAFIDADKEGYIDYYECVLELLRPGGVVMVDNVLWGGAVVDSDDHDDDTMAIRAFNEKLRADERVDISLVPIGDGLTLARKR